MPPIRSLQAAKPLKTERTHEENQERAYIAASRRSDRSLEARIESARRASEIHKKRTGRALRVTEQDVINEEMYEEEDDLPAQYQRLTAHLQSNSLVFNRKLHDYIATQTAVRNSFMQQYQNPYAFQQPLTPNGHPQGIQPFMGQQMMPPAMFSQHQHQQQQQQHFSPHAFQHSPQDYRQSPYPMPNRPQSHQRSASIPTPQQMSDYHQSPAQLSPVAGTPQNNEPRRMSLPPGALDTMPHHMADPQSQVLSINPLSMSLPPESQQFVGSALDPNDPTTAILMAGSESIQQPFRKGYHYNPNVSPKTSQAWGVTNSETAYPNVTASTGMNSTLAPGSTIKVDTPTNTSFSGPHSAVSEDLGSPSTMFGHPSFDIGNYGDMYQNADYSIPSGSQGSQEDFDGNAFFNFCNE